ncbi:MAG: DNA-directed DNA polymerase I [Candidatus Bathyarchaeota archaeon]
MKGITFIETLPKMFSRFLTMVSNSPKGLHNISRQSNDLDSPSSFKDIGKSSNLKAPSFQFETPNNIAESYLLTTTYDGTRHAVCLKFYDPKTRKIFFWYDNTEHKPYCFSDLPADKLEAIEALKNHQGLDHIETVEKYDPLQFKTIKMSKIVAKDPLSIGGMSAGSIRDILPKAWEANIKYYDCYTYDKQLLMGMAYKIVNSKLSLIEYHPPNEIFKTMEELATDKDLKSYVERWNQLLQYPIPKILRAAIDIEVFTSVVTRFPDPQQAIEPIIAASIVDSDGKNRILVLKNGDKDKEKEAPQTLNIEFYEDEKEIITELFKALLFYPIILTYNGDDFDLRYIYHRSLNLGFTKEDIPIILGSRSALLKYGVHIDLYRFFSNRSIQIYAFSQRYSDKTLNGVAKSLLGQGKIELSKKISELSHLELAEYCLRDSQITLQLTTFDDELVIQLIIVLARITKMPIEDLTRQGVSSWIKNLMYFEHRRLNYLIPRSEDILKTKGEIVSTAIIKGKKYKGAIVVNPKPGVHFNIAVLDFASLYPSIIKVYNLSYETILCPHQECRTNKIPDLPHWVCRLNKGLSSLIIGSLRDMRVKWYKKKAKDKTLPQSLRNLYNVVQLTLKVLLNASYGVMGAEAFGLYCPPLAEAVTAIGRHSITKAIERAERLGIDVVYGDTDSIFLKAPTQKQIEELLNWSEKELGMELEIDKFYRYAVFSNLKKNYLGVYPDGNVDIKGLTGKKKHIPEFLKRAFMEMIRTLGEVNTPKDFDAAKTKISEIVKTCYIKLKNRQYPITDLALNIMISKLPSGYTKTTPQHVKAATLLVKAGFDIKPGDIISFIKTTNNLGVRPVQLADVREVDIEKYIEYLESTFEQVLDAAGINFDDIMGISKLESFLW